MEICWRLPHFVLPCVTAGGIPLALSRYMLDLRLARRPSILVQLCPHLSPGECLGLIGPENLSGNLLCVPYPLSPFWCATVVLETFLCVPYPITSCCEQLPLSLKEVNRKSGSPTVVKNSGIFLAAPSHL